MNLSSIFTFNLQLCFTCVGLFLRMPHVRVWAPESNTAAKTSWRMWFWVTSTVSSAQSSVWTERASRHGEIRRLESSFPQNWSKPTSCDSGYTACFRANGNGWLEGISSHPPPMTELQRPRLRYQWDTVGRRTLEQSASSGWVQTSDPSMKLNVCSYLIRCQ